MLSQVSFRTSYFYLVCYFPQTMDGHTNSVISLLVVNRLMYTGSSDGSAKCWVTEFGDCTRQYKGHRGSVINMKFQTGIRQYLACLDSFT